MRTLRPSVHELLRLCSVISIDLNYHTTESAQPCHVLLHCCRLHGGSAGRPVAISPIMQLDRLVARYAVVLLLVPGQACSSYIAGVTRRSMRYVNQYAHEDVRIRGTVRGADPMVLVVAFACAACMHRCALPVPRQRCRPARIRCRSPSWIHGRTRPMPYAMQCIRRATLGCSCG